MQEYPHALAETIERREDAGKERQQMVQIWDIGRAALLFLSLWGYFFVIYRFGKVKSWFVPIVCMAGISLTLFWGGLLDRLAETADLILAAGMVCFLLFLILCVRGKVRGPGWSLCGVIFAAGTGIFALLSLDLKLIHYDNFSHWAVIVKYLLSADQFPGADTVLIAFRDYPPGSSLFIYYVCRYAGRSQGVMLLAQNSMILSCFYAVFGIVKEKRRFLLYSFLGAGCAVLSYLNLTIRINNLLVDFLLPLLVMASAAVSYRCWEEKGRLCMLQIILLGFTGIVKNTGLFFAGAALVFALAMLFCRRKSEGLEETAKSERRGVSILSMLLWGMLMIGGTVLPAAAWRYHLNTDLAGFTGKFEQRIPAVGEQEEEKMDTEEYYLEGLNAGEYGAPVGEDQYGQVTEDFLAAVSDPGSRAAQMFYLCTVLAAGAVLYGRIRLKKRWRLGWILPAGIVLVILYYTGMLYMYLFTMPAGEAVQLAGFERYACSVTVLYAGILIMGATVDIEHSFAVDIDERGAYRAYSSPGAKRRYQYAVLGTILLGLNFLYSEFNGLLSIRSDYDISLPGRAEQSLGDRWYEGGETDRQRYLIVASDENGQVSSGEVRYVCRYFLWAPDVEVTESLTAQEREKAEEEYDCIIVLR